MAISARLGYEENIIIGIRRVAGVDLIFLHTSMPSPPFKKTSRSIKLGLFFLMLSQAFCQLAKVQTSNPFFLSKDFTMLRRSTSSSKIKIFAMQTKLQKACNS